MSEAGTSIIRIIDICDGSNTVIGLEITAYIIRREEHWSVFIWNDTGHEEGFDHIPIPPTGDFTPVAADLQFVSFALKAIRQGRELWTTAKYRLRHMHSDQELLDFNAAAISQYINTVEEVLAEIGSPSEFSTYEHTKLEAILHYDYIKARLTRLIRNLAEVRVFLRQPPVNWSQSSTASPHKPDEHPSRLLAKAEEDFQFIFERAQSLVAICDDGKSTLISNASVQDALRSAAEAKLVTRLTKATNRVILSFYRYPSLRQFLA